MTANKMVNRTSIIIYNIPSLSIEGEVYLKLYSDRTRNINFKKYVKGNKFVICSIKIHSLNCYQMKRKRKLASTFCNMKYYIIHNCIFFLKRSSNIDKNRQTGKPTFLRSHFAFLEMVAFYMFENVT